MIKLIYSSEITLRKLHQGQDGAPGTSQYIHIMYSESSDGNPMFDIRDNPDLVPIYMGVAITLTDDKPNDYEKYTWMKIQGDKGANGAPGRPGQQGIPGANGVSAFVHIKFSNDGGQTFTNNDGEDPGPWIGIYTDDTERDSMEPSDYTWTKIEGESSVSVILTNEAHTFQGGDNVAIPAEVESKVLAYRGSMQIPVDIVVPQVPDGMTFTVENNNTVNAGFVITITEKLKEFSGTIKVPINIEGTQLTKDFSWTVSMRGEKGEEAAVCTVSGEQVFKYLSDATAPEKEFLELTAEYKNTEHKEWQYKAVSGAWTSFTPAREELTVQISPNDICWNNSDFAVVRAIDISEAVYDSMTLLKARDGSSGEASLTATLSNDSHTIPTDADGLSGNYYGAETTMSVYRGSTDVSDEFIYSAVASEGITGTLVQRTYTVTEMTADSGYVDITAKKDGYPDVVKRFNLSLSKSGKNATTYWLVTNASVIFKDDLGINPTVLELSGNCKTGSEDISLYAARFEIYQNDALVYSSTVDETGYKYTVPTDTEDIRVVMYEAGGTGKILDEQNIPTVTDGRPGHDGYTVYLTNQNESFPCDSDGKIIKDISTSTMVIAYKGIEEINVTIGTLPTVPGLRLSTVTSDDGKAMIMITALTGSELAEKGSLEIPVIIDDKTLHAVFSWTKLLDATGLKDEVEHIRKTALMVNKDEGYIQGLVSDAVIAESEEGKVTVGSMYTEWKLDIDGITQKVSEMETDFDGTLNTHETLIQQTSKKLDLIATSNEGSSSITLTPDFISMVSKGIKFDGVLSFYNSVATGDAKTEINGSKITTGILQSFGYEEPTEDTGEYSKKGTSFNLDDGTIRAEHFAIIDGKLYAEEGNFTGTVNATGGTFSGDIVVNGSFTGGVLKSSDFLASTSTNAPKYSQRGMEINLAAKTISTPKTYLHSDGTLYTSYIEATGGKFKGSIEATSGSFTGEVKATTGIIGGFTIGSNALYKDLASLSSSGAGVYIGTDGLNLGGRFTADSLGSVYCNDINIRGGYIKIGQNFEVLTDGTVRAVNGEFAGNIDATSIKALEKYQLYMPGNDETATIITAQDWYYEGAGANKGVIFSLQPDRVAPYIYLSQFMNYQGYVQESSIQIESSNINIMQTSGYDSQINMGMGRINISASDKVIVTKGNLCFGETPLRDIFAEESHTHSEYGYPEKLYFGSTALVETSIGSNRNVFPTQTGTTNLGYSERRWMVVNALRGNFTGTVTCSEVNQTSDANDKMDIVDIPETYKTFFMSLRPRSYLLNPNTLDDECEHRHIGFIAQEVEESLISSGMPLQSFGGLYKEQQETPLSDGRTQRYGLGYSEFTVLNTYMIQKLYKTIEQLSDAVQKQQEQIDMLLSSSK